MGGAYLAQGNTANYPAEFNIFGDPEAAKVVFDNWPNLTMVSWEATIDHGIPYDSLQRLLSLDNPRSIFLEQITRKFIKFLQNNTGGEMSFAADPLAMAVLIEPEIILDSVEKFVQIETHGSLSRGMTIVDWFDMSDRAPNINIVRKVDADRFMALFRLAFE